MICFFLGQTNKNVQKVDEVKKTTRKKRNEHTKKSPVEKYMYTQSINMYLKLYVHTLNSAFITIMAERTQQ